MVLGLLALVLGFQTAMSEEYLMCSSTDDYCLPKDYDKGKLPPNPPGTPLHVAIEFDLLQFTRTEDKEFWLEVKLTGFSLSQ